jgi:hypothetical protein
MTYRQAAAHKVEEVGVLDLQDSDGNRFLVTLCLWNLRPLWRDDGRCIEALEEKVPIWHVLALLAAAIVFDDDVTIEELEAKFYHSVIGTPLLVMLKMKNPRMANKEGFASISRKGVLSLGEVSVVEKTESAELLEHSYLSVSQERALWH